MRLLIFCLCLLVPACADAKYEFLLHKAYAQRYAAFDTLFYAGPLLDLDSANAFKEINTLLHTAEKGGDKELWLEGRLVRTAYLHTKVGAPYSQPYIDTMLALLHEANSHDVRQLQVRLHYMLSLEYLVTDKYDLSFEHEIRYYNLLKGMTPEAFPWKKLCIAHIAGLYYSFEDYDNAKKYLLEAYRLKGSYNRNDDIDVNNTLGLIMRNTHKYDSALYYFSKGLAIAQQCKNINWEHVIKGNIGIVYYYRQQYAQAVPLLKEDIGHGIRIGDYRGIVNSMIKLADIYRIQGSHDSAMHYTALARSHITHTWHPYEHLVQLYQLNKEMAAGRGDAAGALRYSDSALVAKDSQGVRKNVLLLVAAQHKVEVQKHQAELVYILSAKKLNVLQRNFLITGIVLLMVIVLLLLNRQAIRHRSLLAEKLLANNNLENAEKRLGAYTQTLHEKNELIENFTAEIERLQALPCSTDLPDTRENLLRLQRATILTEEQWQDFRDVFETVHAGYIDRLKVKLPGLTPAELRIMVLAKLKMNNKEMAGILGIDTGTVRYHKHNLRKKIDNTEDDNIDELAEKI